MFEDNKIPDWAFEGCPLLVGIEIDGITEIGVGAFYGCKKLTSVTIPESVAIIKNNAFEGCTKLAKIEVAADNVQYSSADGVLFDKSRKKLIACPEGKQGAYVIPDGVTVIAERAFYNCTWLTSVTIPEGVTSIGASAFEGCAGLTSIDIPAGVIAIGNHAFRRCSHLAAINVAGCSSGVLFSKTKKTLITCPEGIEDRFTVPEGVTAIGERAFEGCAKLWRIIIPESVTSIGDNAFEGCDGLHQIFCMCATPPKVTNSSLTSKKLIGLLVPDESLHLYKKDEAWEKFYFTFPLSVLDRPPKTLEETLREYNRKNLSKENETFEE
jgi:hypothetical protein